MTSEQKQEKTETQAGWASKAWFKAQIGKDNGASYFGHEHNGYQIFRHLQLIKSLARVADGLEKDAMLDVGCATGVLTNNFRRRFGFNQAVGMDFIHEVLQKGRRINSQIDFFEGALPNLPFSKQHFDLVLASEVLYYLTPEAQDQAIGEIEKVLKRGGYFLVGSVLGSDYFSPEKLNKLLERKFKVVCVSELYMRYYHKIVAPFYYATRLEDLLASGSEPGSNAMKKKFHRILPLLTFLPVRLMLKIFVFLGRPILASTRLPAIINVLSRWTQASNIIVIGQKP